MRRRAVRDMGTILGVILILVVVAFANSQLRRGSLKERMEKVRQEAEKKQSSSGIELLSWDYMRKTKGTLKTGASFDQRLIEKDGQPVSLIGFMVPEYEFRQMTQFMVLPVPIQCYFCESPPTRDVMYVKMAEGEKANLVNEPVIINGVLTLHKGPGQKYFYTISDAQMGAAERGGKLTTRSPRPEAIQHATEMQKKEQGKEEKLLPGEEPPVAPAPSATLVSPSPATGAQQ